MPDKDDDPLLTQREAAEYLHISVRTLQRWRDKDIGPPSFVLPNGYRRYRRGDVTAWLEAQGERPSP